MANYRLFYSPGACSLAPHIVLEELGLPYEPVRVTIAEGENTRPEYLAINPRGRVPALAYSDAGGAKVLTESIAILVFLAQRHREAQLLPDHPEMLARALEWMCWLGANMHQAGVRTVFRPERFTVDALAAPGIAAQGRISIRAGYEDVERRLHGRGGALGDRFSVVDAQLLVFYRWGNRCGLDMRRDFPEYTCLMDAVRARPAVQRVVAREGIQID
jgi:glutathione S-transferase